jgi:hypothetical protein
LGHGVLQRLLRFRRLPLRVYDLLLEGIDLGAELSRWRWGATAD